MTSVLTPDEVSVALAALPGWEGDSEALVRTVPAADADLGTLRDAIAAVADEANHHPLLENTPAGLRVALRTNEAGGVTARDVELATRLDRLFSGGVAWDKY